MRDRTLWRQWPLALLLAALAGLNLPPAQAADVTPDEARAIAEEAYVYGYPLVTMEMTRRVLTNTAAPEGIRAPMGQFALLREYPTRGEPQVTAPNADTLYSMAWLDLSKEPYVFGIPDTGDRYYLMPMLDGWTEVFQVPGQRTTGNGAQTYAITGPGLEGHAAGGPHRVQVADQPGVDPRPHLLHRHAGGLRGGARHPGQALAGAAQRLRQALHAAAGPRRSQHRHEDADPRPGQPDGRGDLLHAAGVADEGQSADGGGRADGGADGEDRHRPGADVRSEAGWAQRSPTRSGTSPRRASRRSWPTSRRPAPRRTAGCSR